MVSRSFRNRILDLCFRVRSLLQMSLEPSEVPNPIGVHLEQAGWLQGAVVKPVDAPALGLDSNADDLWVVITQSCDLVHDPLEDEPWVEIVRASRVGASDGNFEDLKNPRRLHLTDTKYGTLELRTKDRRLINRERLRGLAPDGVLEPTPLRTLQTFMARRYNRAAFASEFNRRRDGTVRHQGEDNQTMKKRVRKVETAFKKLNQNLHMILVTDGVLEEELQPWTDDAALQEPYKFALVGVFDATKEGVNERDLEAAMKELTSALNACPGILIKDQEPDLRSFTDLDYATLNSHTRWDADAISARAGVPVPTDNSR